MKARDVIRYIEGLRLTQGPRAGEQFAVLPWQRRAIQGLYTGGAATAAISVGRGGGKTTLLGALAAAAISPDGPHVDPRSDIVVVASSFAQARICAETCAAFLEPLMDAYPRDWRRQDSAQAYRLTHRPTGISLRAISSDPKRAHGLAPALVIADELAQWPGNTAESMWAALSTSDGKIDDGRIVAIGTRPANSEHQFARLLAGAADYAQIHSARPGDNIHAKATWRRANPSIPHRPELLAAYARGAERARSDPAELAAFKALRLNMGVSDQTTRVLMDADRWLAAECDDTPRAGEPVWGLDLATTGQAAIVAFWPATGRLDAVAAFPRVPTLTDRGLQDGVGDRYVRMGERGELLQLGREVVDVRALMNVARDRWGYPAAIALDAWRRRELHEALSGGGWPPIPVISRRNGYKDGGEDLRAFSRAFGNGKVHPVESLLLRSALSGAVVVQDAAGNERIGVGTEGGRRSRHRDDAAIATTLAIGIAERAGAIPGLEGRLSQPVMEGWG